MIIRDIIIITYNGRFVNWIFAWRGARKQSNLLEGVASVLCILIHSAEWLPQLNQVGGNDCEKMEFEIGC